MNFQEVDGISQIHVFDSASKGRSVKSVLQTQLQMKTLINSKYQQNLWLGKGVSDYIVLKEGMFRDYDKGSIYVKQNMGNACIVMGMIKDKWIGLGGVNSFLGYPRTDELTPGDGIGRFNDFEKGTISWYPGAGAHETHGLIRNKYAELNWESGILGYPISDELVAEDGIGRYSEFQRGKIYYHPTYGTHYISYGKLYLFWADQGGILSSFGYPTGDPVTKNGTTTQVFTKSTLSTEDSRIKNRVDLRKEIARRGIEVRNQGHKHLTCVEHTMVFLQEYALTALCGKVFNHLSVPFNIQAGNRVESTEKENSNFRRSVAGYEQYGTVVSDSWPYDPEEEYDYDTWDAKMTTQLINNGKFMLRKGLKLKGHYISQKTPLTDKDINTVIGYLDKGIPVAQAHSHHAMPIVGYEKNSTDEGGGHFIFRNSYGVKANDHGYLTATFSKLKKVDKFSIYVIDGVER